MMKNLDILYISDDGFTEVVGVSITSLFEKNPRRKIHLTVYLLGVDITAENKKKFEKIEKHYGQKIVLIDATELYEEVKKLDLSEYRGSAMTNLRLYFDKLIPDTVERLLYLDCDTIICDSLLELCDYSLQGKMLAMAMDAYGKVLCKDKNACYYNAGVILIDCNRWRTEYWREKIEEFIVLNTRNLAHPDQDVFNIVCKDEIQCLPIRYNFQVVHREYTNKLYFRYLGQDAYYDAEEIKEAKKKPGILHLVRVLGTNPWYEDGHIHPDYKIYQFYKKKSPWKETRAKASNAGFTIRVERIINQLLPNRLFLPIKLKVLKAVLAKVEKDKIK